MYRQQPSDFYIMLKVRWQAEFQRVHSEQDVSPLAMSLMDKCSFTLVCQANSDNRGVEIIPRVIGRLLVTTTTTFFSHGAIAL